VIHADCTATCGGFRLTLAGLELSEQQPVTALVGPSGAGKSTALRCMAGLLRPDSGRITCGSTVWFDAERHVHLRPERRRLACVFQDYALFPHMSALDNVAYGITGNRRHRKALAQGWLERMSIADLQDRLPGELSGGQQQRVAIARALARGPRLLLLDEPLAALDAPLRTSLRQDLRRLLVEQRVLTLLVTHDRADALALGDRTGVIVDGTLRQLGETRDVFARPADAEVAAVLGTDTVVPCRVTSRNAGFATIRIGNAELQVLDPGHAGDDAFACIRAEEVLLQRTSHTDTSARNRLQARIASVEPQGAMFRVRLDCGFSLAALVTPASISELGLEPGQQVTAVLKVPAVHLVPRT
jgi:molybdate transport system ATP-binding protein